MNISERIEKLRNEIPSYVKIVAVSKTHPPGKIREAYQAGHKIFGENRVQELLSKKNFLPEDTEWHLIGHLQTNKVKHIVPFVSLIHSVDSLKLLKEINTHSEKIQRITHCLLQIHIAQEKTKFGLNFREAEQILLSEEFRELKNIRIIGMMGMATMTEEKEQIRKEFRSLKNFFDSLTSSYPLFSVLSMGMSSDYQIAIEEGSTMIRVGALIFGNRK